MGCCDWHDAVDAVDHMLQYGLGLTRVAKQLDPTNDGDFITISNRLRRRFEDVAGPVERQHVRRAIDELDVDWVNLSAEQQSAVVRAANLALRDIPASVLPAMTVRMRDVMRDVVGETLEAVNDQFQLGIGTSLNAVDRRVVEAAVRAQSTFATDVYGARVAEFDQVARDTVADGLSKGLRSPEIAANLAAAAQRINLERSRSYWQVVSSSAVSRARTYGQLRGFQDAAIDRYRFDAVLDEATTNVCRMMDGRVFDVRAGLDRLAQVEAGGDVKELQPWVRQRKLEDGRTEMFIRRGDEEDTVGIVEESAVGRLDERGRFSGEMTEAQLVDAGVLLPPLHGLCRSTVLPVF